MKVVVENDNPKVIEKLNTMGIPELEILTVKENGEEAIKVAKTEKLTLVLNRDRQEQILAKKDGDEAAAELVNILMEDHASDFFSLKPMGVAPVKVNKKKKAKNRKKNKAARAARKKNRKR
jgi:hypothetical protein